VGEGGPAIPHGSGSEDGPAAVGGEDVRRGLSRADVEALASHVYLWREHLDDDGSYWVTARHAKGILSVNHTRLDQLAVRGFVPFEVHFGATRCTAANR
jgi:hypothetical protein